MGINCRTSLKPLFQNMHFTYSRVFWQELILWIYINGDISVPFLEYAAVR